MLLPPVDPNERFRARRRQARRRRAARRIAALTVVALAAAGLTLGARFLNERDTKSSATPETTKTGQASSKPKPQPRSYPPEMRGIHVTMALASLEGKIDQYLKLTRHGLNTLELDIKDENGDVAFRHPVVALAHRSGAAQNYYDPYEVASEVHASGVYLIGRIVV